MLSAVAQCVLSLTKVLPMVNSDYQAPFLFRNGHVHTICSTVFRKVNDVSYRRERIDTADQDFLDLDWSTVGGDSLAIISHGLEGDSRRPYVKGMVRAMNRAGIDALAWNFRGCSGETNRLLGLYHNGSIDDLHAVVCHAAPAYKRIFLIGFSMGGNMGLLYLGKLAKAVPRQVQGSISFSVPCDLTDASVALARKENTLYMKRFLLLLHQKIKIKKAHFPRQIDDHGYHRLKSFKDFDGRYTAPIHGFASAEDYWQQCSCRPWLSRIRVPSLIVNALDDPFLAGGCYPVEECAGSPHVRLEITRYGGHVGFMARNGAPNYWSEERALAFIRQLEER
ncbi:MAG: alpha/beta fold hydrolase [Desulfuromonadales bacterium]|nr:alpha/beta fold hydrolase [Desulfuromonadales bacterium]